MSKLENFISRWSRLKRLSEPKRKRDVDLRESAALSSAAVTAEADEDVGSEIQKCAARTFDPAGLPSIDSITAATDIRAFLQLDVPAKLTQAALRRAWVSDPAIRDFIGIAENQWDFTDPGAIPGFGPLQDTRDARALIAQAVAALDSSLDRSPARLPDNCASAGKLPPATDDSRHNELDNKTHEAQTTLATRTDREASGPALEDTHPETPPQHGRSRESTAPRQRRNAHGGAVPR